jgi:hypothetical protein
MSVAQITDYQSGIQHLSLTTYHYPISSSLQHVMVHDIQYIHPKQSSPAGSLCWFDGRFDAAGSEMPKRCLGNTNNLSRL